MSETIVVALISTAGLVIVGSIPVLSMVVSRIIDRSTDAAASAVMSKNTEEHMANAEVLARIEKKVDIAAEKVDAHGDLLTTHLTWHIAHPQKEDAAA